MVMQSKQSESVGVTDLVRLATADGNKRVEQFRDRKASAGLERLEIYTSKLVKDQVREFAEAKGLTRGVAAEVLLQNGIAAYISETQRAAVSGGLKGSVSEEVAADVYAEPSTIDSIPSWVVHIRDAKVKIDHPQQAPIASLASDSSVATHTQMAPEPADSKPLPEVIERQANVMVRCIREGSPQHKTELAKDRLKTETKG